MTGTRNGSTRKSASGRSTKRVVRQRVEEIFILRLGGAEFHDICEFARRSTDDDGKPCKPWGVSEAQLRRYIAAADKLCKARFDAKADHLLARHLLQRRRLFAQAIEVGDYKTALAILQDEAKLEGLYPTDSGQSGGGPTVIVQTVVNVDHEAALGRKISPGQSAL
jgi:hypothetical protein